MSKSMKSNIIHTAMWTIVTVGLIIIFSLPNTIDNWGDNRIKTLLLAILFLLGFGTDFVLRIAQKSQKHGYKTDERDRTIQLEAVFKAFVVLLLYIFMLAIVLYLVYENAGLMPVGWVWFLAYSTIAFANLLMGLFVYTGYRKMGM